MSTMGMQVELSMTAKGVQATLKDAQGAIVQTAAIMKSQLPAASDAAGQGIAKLKAGMGQARETAMFFTQSLQGFGDAGRIAQGAISGVVGGFIGGGGLLAGLSLAKTAVELLTAAWEADTKAAEEAAKKSKAAAKEIVDGLAQVAKSEQDALDSATYNKRTLLDRQYVEARKKLNVELAESRKRTGDDVTSEETKGLLAERARLDAEYKKAKGAIKGNDEVAQVDAGAASFAKGEEKKRQELDATARKRDEDTKAYMTGVNAELKAEVEAANERGATLLAEEAADRRRKDASAEASRQDMAAQLAADYQARKIVTEKEQKDQERFLNILKPITTSIQDAFAGVVQGTMSVGDAFKKVLASTIQVFLQTAIQQIAANAAVAGAGAAASQAPIPFAGPALAAAAMAAVMGMVMGLTSMISASGGADIGNYAPVAQLHPREMVLPAHIADPLRDSLSSGGLGGGSITVNLSAVDAKGVRRLLLDNQSALAEAIGKAVRDGRRMS